MAPFLFGEVSLRLGIYYLQMNKISKINSGNSCIT